MIKRLLGAAGFFVLGSFSALGYASTPANLDGDDDGQASAEEEDGEIGTTTQAWSANGCSVTPDRLIETKNNLQFQASSTEYRFRGSVTVNCGRGAGCISFTVAGRRKAPGGSWASVGSTPYTVCGNPESSVFGQRFGGWSGWASNPWWLANCPGSNQDYGLWSKLTASGRPAECRDRCSNFATGSSCD